MSAREVFLDTMNQWCWVVLVVIIGWTLIRLTWKWRKSNV